MTREQDHPGEEQAPPVAMRDEVKSSTTIYSDSKARECMDRLRGKLDERGSQISPTLLCQVLLYDIIGKPTDALRCVLEYPPMGTGGQNFQIHLPLSMKGRLREYVDMLKTIAPKSGILVDPKVISLSSLTTSLVRKEATLEDFDKIDELRRMYRLDSRHPFAK
jgi:hypothetical protein